MWGVSQPATIELSSPDAGTNLIPARVPRCIQFPCGVFCFAPTRPPFIYKLFEYCGAGSKAPNVNGFISSEVSTSLYPSVANLFDLPHYPQRAGALDQSPRILVTSRRHSGAAAAGGAGRDAVLQGVTEGRMRNSMGLLSGRSRRT